MHKHSRPRSHLVVPAFLVLAISGAGSANAAGPISGLKNGYRAAQSWEETKSFYTDPRNVAQLGAAAAFAQPDSLGFMEAGYRSGYVDAAEGKPAQRVTPVGFRGDARGRLQRDAWLHGYRLGVANAQRDHRTVARSGKTLSRPARQNALANAVKPASAAPVSSRGLRTAQVAVNPTRAPAAPSVAATPAAAQPLHRSKPGRSTLLQASHEVPAAPPSQPVSETPAPPPGAKRQRGLFGWLRQRRADTRRDPAPRPNEPSLAQNTRSKAVPATPATVQTTPPSDAFTLSDAAPQPERRPAAEALVGAWPSLNQPLPPGPSLEQTPTVPPASLDGVSQWQPTGTAHVIATKPTMPASAPTPARTPVETQPALLPRPPAHPAQAPFGDAVRVGLAGAVRKPGIYTVPTHVASVGELLRHGEGLQETASGKIKVVRIVGNPEQPETLEPFVVRADLYDTVRLPQLLQTPLKAGDLIVVEGDAARVYVANLPAWLGEIGDVRAGAESVQSLLARNVGMPTGASQGWLIRTDLRGRSDALRFPHSTQAIVQSDDVIYLQQPVAPSQVATSPPTPQRRPTINLAHRAGVR